MRDRPRELIMSDDEEIGPAGQYEQDSDSEDEDGHPVPPAKRASELYACAVPNAASGKPLRPMPVSPYTPISDLHTAETPGEQSRRVLQALMAIAEVERILSELGDHPELQLPKHQKKLSRKDEVQWRTDCAEIYFQ